MGKEIVVTLILIIAIVIYLIFRERKKKFIFLSRKNSVVIDEIDTGSSVEVLSRNVPKLFNGMTLSFWIYIDTFYMNDGYWRHIMHKGSSFDNVSMEKWKDVKKVKKQFPGVWLHPNINNLRVTYQTTNGIDYCDLENVPIKEPICITIVLENRALFIYMNGKLMESKVFLTEPKMNKGNIYICNPLSFSGKLVDFIYYNQAVSNEGVMALVNRKKKIKI